MSMQPTDRLQGPVRGDPETAISFAERHGAARLADVAQYIEAVFRYAPEIDLDPAIVIAQSGHETGNWTSHWWRERLNPAGLGITGDPDQNAASGTWATGERAALAQLHHLGLYLGTDMLAWKPYNPRWQAAIQAGYFGVAATLDDLGGRWAVDRRYGEGVAARGNAIFPHLPNQGQEGPDMALPIPIFEQRIAPRGIPNRTNLAMPSPSYLTVHEVGNTSPGATTEMHVRFVHNGGGRHNVSFHFIVGPDKVCQLIELDEACWHASDGYNGRGNRDTIAIETIQIGDFDTTLFHLAWLCAEIITTPDRFAWKGEPPRPLAIDENDHTQHNWWAPDGKNCPQFIRERGLWEELMRRVDAYLMLARTPDAPDTPKPLPVPAWAPAMVPDWMTEDWIEGGEDAYLGETKVFSCRRRWTPAQDTRRLQHSGPGSPEIGGILRKGESFIGIGIYKSHGEWWILTPWGTRLRMAHMTDRMIPGYPEEEAAEDGLQR